MHYIINETNQIIAIDNELLQLCGYTHIDELNNNITLKNIRFNLDNNDTLTIKSSEKVSELSTNTIPLSTLIGKLTLIKVNKATEEKPEDIYDNETKFDSLVIEKNIPNNEQITIYNIEKESINTTTPHEKIKEDNDNNDTQFDNLVIEKSLPNTEYLTINHTEKESIKSTTSYEKTKEYIFIDVPLVSEKIGVSEDDYNAFLNEYISTALNLEKDLQSEQRTTRENAINTLIHLGDVLHIEEVGNIIKKIKPASQEERSTYVTAFYDTLSRITTNKPHSEKKRHDLDLDIVPTEKNIIESGFNKAQNIATQEIISNLEKESITLDLEEPANTSDIMNDQQKSETDKVVDDLGILNLSNVQPIHFDFSLRHTSDELLLPESIIEEFIADFVEQAHSETDKMLHAYKNTDLATIQESAHLLKDISNNLRIKPLADTLHRIQFCKNSNDIGALIQTYWGHFLAFKKQVNL